LIDKHKIYSELIHGKLKVTLHFIGEGWHGDWNKNDPTDEQLLRFDLYCLTNGEWDTVANTSHCTQLSSTTPKWILDKAVTFIMKKFEENYPDGPLKTISENLSWLNPEYFNPKLIKEKSNGQARLRRFMDNYN
jgi:hypothetical protein